MHHRMPPSKTGLSSSNMVIFPPVLRLVLDDPKQWPPRRLFIKFTKLILEDHRISAKSIAEQLGTSREGVGCIVHEDVDMRKLSAKWVPKCLSADPKRQLCQTSEQLLEFCRRDRSDFLSGAIGDHGLNLVILLWPGDKTTNTGVATWRLTPPQKNPSAKIRWKCSRLDVLGSRRHPPHWLSFKGSYYQRWVLPISAGTIGGHFERKTPLRVEVTKGALFLHDNAPAHRALATQKKLAYLCFQCLDHPPYSPDLALSDYHLFPGLKKKQ